MSTRQRDGAFRGLLVAISGLGVFVSVVAISQVLLSEVRQSYQKTSADIRDASATVRARSLELLLERLLDHARQQSAVLLALPADASSARPTASPTTRPVGVGPAPQVLPVLDHNEKTLLALSVIKLDPGTPKPVSERTRANVTALGTIGVSTDAVLALHESALARLEQSRIESLHLDWIDSAIPLLTLSSPLETDAQGVATRALIATFAAEPIAQILQSPRGAEGGLSSGVARLEDSQARLLVHPNQAEWRKGGALPALPGSGESLRPVSVASLRVRVSPDPSDATPGVTGLQARSIELAGVAAGIVGIVLYLLSLLATPKRLPQSTSAALDPRAGGAEAASEHTGRFLLQKLAPKSFSPTPSADAGAGATPSQTAVTYVMDPTAAALPRDIVTSVEVQAAPPPPPTAASPAPLSEASSVAASSSESDAASTKRDPS